MKKTLRPYQKENIRDIFSKLRENKKQVDYQLPTGGGKTFTATEIIHYFLEKNKPFEVVFLVHRVELLTQFKRTFEGQHPDYEVGIIDRYAKMKRFDLRINVAMVETAKRRLKKNPKFFGNKTRLLIVDECHNSSFDKIFKYFSKSLVIGLTATPMRLSKRNPMNRVYNDIVCGPTIQYLIEQGSLAPNKTFTIDSGVNYSQIKKTSGDYNKGAIFDEYSKAKHINNVVKAYEMKAKGKKTIIFNASVEHSELVNKAFVMSGYNSKHLDGATNKNKRLDILDWFARTPDSILHNIGILQMGFDEPSIEAVIMNRPTASLPLWLQCMGRGSRVYPGKDYFTIIDLGGNVERLGDWSSPFDWNDIFKNAKYKDGEYEGVAPTKDCPECGYIMPLQTMTCPECGHKMSSGEIEENTEEIKLKLIADNFSKKINLHKIDDFVEKRGWKKYSGLYMIRDVFLRDLKNQNINPETKEYDELHRIYFSEVEKWCEKNGKKFNKWHKDFADKIVNEQLKEVV